MKGTQVRLRSIDAVMRACEDIEPKKKTIMTGHSNLKLLEQLFLRLLATACLPCSGTGTRNKSIQQSIHISGFSVSNVIATSLCIKGSAATSE